MMANEAKTIYVGRSADLIRRVREHKDKIYPNSFTAKRDIAKLVWYIGVDSLEESIILEKEMKSLLRVKKTALVEDMNPGWEDLSQNLF